ncbi:MAG: hypothetical protein ABSA86_15310 [Oryzomonas sp.]|jgi:hypothetical protein
MTAFQPKQIYKNRADAYRNFVLPQGLPVGQTKFYNDAERLQMIRIDKTIELASLMAYIRTELQLDPTTGQSLVEREQEEKSAKLDLREKELKVDKLEREQRRDDGRWLLRDEAILQMAALIGKLRGACRRRFHPACHELIRKCNGDQSHENEIFEFLDLLLRQSFNDVAGGGKVEGMLVKKATEGENSEE